MDASPFFHPGVAPTAWDLRQETARIEQVWEQVAAEVLERVPAALTGPVRYALETRGKRLRPVLCCAAYEAIRGEVPAGVRRLACSLELVHTYSLVHDDLPCMDDDDLRRGRATTHRVWGTGLAVLAGAALIPAAMRLLHAEASFLGLDRERTGTLIAELVGAAGAAGMVGGQWRDLEAELEPVDAVGLEQIHRSKTGALLRASLRIGAIAATATPDQLQALSWFGEHLGVAFQIVDDLLDVEGSPATTGKAGGRDQILGKSTYPGLFGIERARAMAAEHADAAQEAVQGAGLATPALTAIRRYVVERRT